MDLQELHERTAIPRRKLRYVLDHGLVPGLPVEIAAGEAGRPRRFHDDVGVAIVCAARLLELGLPHETIRHFLAGLVKIELRGKGRGRGEPALRAVLERRWPATAHLGDGVNVRLTVEDLEYDSGWHAPAGAAPVPRTYRPFVHLSLDLGRIQAQIFGGGA